MMQMQAMNNPMMGNATMGNPMMGMAAGMNPMMMGMGTFSNNPSFFYFTGNSLSLQSRLNGMSD